MASTLAATPYSASAVHALLEIDAHGCVTAAQLAEFLGLDKSSVSRMVAKLIAHGELQEQPCADDARAKQLQLSAQGQDTVAGIHAYGQTQVRSALAQPSGDLRLGAGVVDDHKAVGRGASAGQHRIDAQLGVCQPAVHGHDDVNGVVGGVQRLRCGAYCVGGGGSAAPEQAVYGHFGVNQGTGSAEHGGVFYGFKV